MNIKTNTNRLLIILFIAIVFGAIPSYTFLEYDDPINITNNELVNRFSINNLMEIWSKPQVNLYIPLTYTLWMLIAFVSKFLTGQILPLFFHTTNLVFHIINSLLVYDILRSIFKIRHKEVDASAFFASFAGALIFALHPVQVEPVAWITGFKDLLYTCFLLIIIRMALGENHAKSNNRNIRKTTYTYLLSTVLFVLAMAAKPSAIVLPVFLPIIFFAVHGKLPDFEPLIFIALWVILSIVTVALTSSVQPVAEDISLLQKGFVACDAIIFYLYKIFLPFTQSLDYGRTINYTLEQKWIYFYPLILLLIVLMLSISKDRALWLSSLALIIVGVGPVLGIIPFAHQRISTVADRYLYLSMFGVSFGGSFFIANYYSKKIILISYGLVFLLAFASINYVGYWRDTETLMMHTLRKNPLSFIANHNLGVVLMKKGDYEKAIYYLERTLKTKNDHALTHYNLALAYACQQNIQSSMKHLNYVKRVNPDLAEHFKKLLPSIVESVRTGKIAEDLKPLNEIKYKNQGSW